MSGRRASVLGVVLALALAAAAPAPAKAPPSFALWTAKYRAQTDKPIDEVGDKCIALHGETADRKIGECWVKGLRVILRRQQPQWERAVAAIAKGQSESCRKAIHRYWLASRKGQAAILIYLDAHQHTRMTEVASDLDEEPHATLKNQTDAAKSAAIRTCG